MPLDINDFREDRGGNVEKLRELQRRRFQPVELVDEIVRLDKVRAALRGGRRLRTRTRRT